jgi:hypothetical protein
MDISSFLLDPNILLSTSFPTTLIRGPCQDSLEGRAAFRVDFYQTKRH